MVLVGSAAGFVLLIILVLGFGIRVVSRPGASAQPLELTPDVVTFVLGAAAETPEISAGEVLLDAYERSVILAWGARLESEAMVSVGAAGVDDPDGRRQAHRDAVRRALMQGRH
jgi:hypothetical protein